MMRVAHPGWPVAVLSRAASVAMRQGDALGLGMEAGLAAEIEDLGSASQNGWDEPGLAR